MDVVLEAIQTLEARLQTPDYVITCNSDVQNYLRLKYTEQEREIFSVMFLDSRHRLLEHREMFFGTVDKAAVYPREIVKAALSCNAAAVILVHNHPSGSPEPSPSDLGLTDRLKEILAIVEVNLLDHFVVGNEVVSFASRGLI